MPDGLSDIAVEAPEPDGPRHFLAPIRTPPGLPWQQQRAAELEAEQAAPLPVGELLIAVRRAAPWRFRAPGSFIAIYVRAEDAGVVLRIPIGGRSTRIVLETRAAQSARRRAQAAQAGLIAAAVVLVGLSAGLALAQRRAETASLLTLQAKAERAARLALKQTELARQDRAFAAVRGDRGTLDDVLAALQWAGSDRAPDVRVEAVHWRPQGVAVEVRGEAAPFVKPVAQRLPQPVRPGVVLWVKGAPPVEPVKP